MSELEVLGSLLIAFGAGLLLGHAVGYGRGKASAIRHIKGIVYGRESAEQVADRVVGALPRGGAMDTPREIAITAVRESRRYEGEVTPCPRRNAPTP